MTANVIQLGQDVKQLEMLSGVLSHGLRLNHYDIFQLNIALFCLLQGRQLQQHSTLVWSDSILCSLKLLPIIGSIEWVEQNIVNLGTKVVVQLRTRVLFQVLQDRCTRARFCRKEWKLHVREFFFS